MSRLQQLFWLKEPARGRKLRDQLAREHLRGNDLHVLARIQHELLRDFLQRDGKDCSHQLSHDGFELPSSKVGAVREPPLRLRYFCFAASLFKATPSCLISSP